MVVSVWVVRLECLKGQLRDLDSVISGCDLLLCEVRRFYGSY